MFKNKNQAKNEELNDIYLLLNNLIKEGKIKFNYYNNSFPLELLQMCQNKTNNTIELKFRDIFKEYIDEFKSISNSKNEK